MQMHSKSGISKPKPILSLSVLHMDSDPTSFSQAIKHAHWRNAMSEEFNAFSTNDTWELVPHTPAMHVIGCKWIYKTKFNFGGSTKHHKVCLVALENYQQASIDYYESLVLLLNRLLFVFCFPLPHLVTGSYDSLMLITPSYMVSLLRRST